MSRCIICVEQPIPTANWHQVWNPTTSKWDKLSINDHSHGQEHIVQGEEAAMKLSDELKIKFPEFKDLIYYDHY